MKRKNTNLWIVFCFYGLIFPSLGDTIPQKSHRHHVPRELRLRLRIPNMDSIEVALPNFDSLYQHLDSLFQNLPVPEVSVKMEKMKRLQRFPQSPPFPPPPAPPVERKSIIRLGGDLVIEENEIVQEEVVVCGGDLTLYGIVHGDVVVVGGDAKIEGEIQGDLAILGGNAEIDFPAKIDGDFLCLGGEAKIEEGTILGDTRIMNWKGLFSKTPSKRLPSSVMVLSHLALIGFLMLVAGFITLVFPNQTQRVADHLRKNYGKSIVVGITSLLLFPFVFLLLLITIIGIPIALFLPLIIGAGLLMGVTAMSLVLGGFIKERFGLRWKSPLLFVLSGMLLLEGILFIGKMASHVFPLFSFWFGLTNVFLVLCTWIAGFGTVVWTRFGTKDREKKKSPQAKKIKKQG